MNNRCVAIRGEMWRVTHSQGNDGAMGERKKTSRDLEGTLFHAE